jgi:hypothetical protein
MKHKNARRENPVVVVVVAVAAAAVGVAVEAADRVAGKRQRVATLP